MAVGDPKQAGEILLLDTATGQVTRELRGHSGWVHGVSYSPDAKTLVSCGSLGLQSEVDGGQLRLWDLAGQKSQVLWQDPEIVLMCVEFSPDGTLFAAGGGRDLYGRPDKDIGVVQIWDATTPKLLFTLKAHLANVESIAFSPDGKILASAGGKYLTETSSPDYSVKFWKAATGLLVDTVEVNDWWRRSKMVVRFTDMAFSPDGAILAVAMGSWNRGGQWGELRFWNRDKGAVERTVLFSNHAEPVVGAAFSKDGKILAGACTDGAISAWDLRRE